MADYRFVRLCRTTHSEAYDIFDEDQPVGRIDLHYSQAVVYGLLAVEETVEEAAIQELIEVIDGEIVDSSESERDDFLVSVYVGKAIGIYSDDVFDDEDLEALELELEDEEASEEPDEDPPKNGYR